MKAPTLKQAKAAALQIHSLIVRHNGNGCAGRQFLDGECRGKLQCAHILEKKQYQWVAGRIANGWVLCERHHIIVDKNFGRKHTLIRRTIGHRWVDDLIETCDLMREDLGMSPLRFWRRELLRLHVLAERWSIDLSSVPVGVKAWAREQQKTTTEQETTTS